jgi:hypothetical protein
MLKYILNIMILLSFMIVMTTTSWAKTVANFQFDYFDQSLDVLDYIEKIDTSSLPESLERFHIDLLVDLNESYSLGFRYTREDGDITRVVEPTFISNQFNTVEYIVVHNKPISEMTSKLYFSVGHTQQREIIMECVQRGFVLLGGNCVNADFQLIDGNAFENSNEFNYLPVLSSSVKASYFKVEPSLFTQIGKLNIRYFLNVNLYNIQHDYKSALFDIQSDFLLDSTINNSSLRQTIGDLREELPQLNAWQDLVLGIGTQLSYQTDDLTTSVSIRFLHSHKINFEKPSLYRNNAELATKFDYAVSSALSIFIKGTAYLHYLQGVQPILYTEKSSRYFEHPYGELSLGMTYQF